MVDFRYQYQIGISKECDREHPTLPISDELINICAELGIDIPLLQPDPEIVAQLRKIWDDVRSYKRIIALPNGELSKRTR